MKKRTIMSKDLKVRKQSMRFLDKRLMALVAVLGLSSSGLAQDANKVAEEALKNKPVAVSPDKVKKVDEILRQQSELEGDGLILEAGELLNFSRFEEAAEKFAEAIGKYQRVSKSEATILKKVSEAEIQQSRALRLFADKLVVEAVENADENSLTAFDKAIGKLQQAKNLDSARTAEIDQQIKIIEEKIAVFEHNDKVGEVRLKREFKYDEQRGSIANGILFERAKILYANRRFVQAKTALEQILTNQPFNQHAVNLLQRTNRKLFEAGRMRRNMQYQEYLDEVEWKWSDPINAYRTEAVIKADVKSVDQDKVLGGIYKKLQIVIPKVRFEDRDLDFVVDFIKRTTRDLDDEGEGLNVIVSVNDTAGANDPAVDAAPADGLGDALDAPLDGPVDAPVAAGGGRLINLDADDIPVGEVIKYICDQLNLKYKVEEFAVIIGDNEKFQQLETNFYTISAGLLEIVQTRTAEGIGGGGGLDGLGVGGGGDGGPNFQAYFQQLGISFPPGAKIKFVQGAMRLVVTNTPENHTKLEEILRQIGIETPQISIESKFIEVNNTDIEELGIEWTVGRPNHLGASQPNGINHQTFVGDPTVATAVNPNIANADLSNGIRDITVLGATGATGPVQAGVNLIMGDYIFQGLIRALEQESSNDVLSAPQVTAVSGKTAVIRIVEERYFPESWETPDISAAFILGSSPQFGEPRDVGIVFEVTPQVEPDGYTISLDLKPQVLEFVRFDTSYDSTINTNNAALPAFNGFAAGVIPVIYQMPILSARTLETRVTIWDGETIMLGGLIREKVIAVDDKVPYLSDIPFVGRLFRNKGQQNEKQNLLVFVSARLIDPAGLPKKPNNNKGLPDFKRL